ncbi:polyphosphate polymerase domain-containing protein, partial [Candidatus Parcubacteria bacterium]
MQASRFELKYVVDEDLALQIREFVRCYLELDENGVGKPNFSYPVHSLYLDSDSLKCYWDTINGNKNRFKLRIRFYNDNPESPLFFEIKRRVNSCIMKQRAAVRREALETILAGQMPDPSALVSKDPKHAFALQNFIRLMTLINAKPKAHIGYLREAYVPHNDNSARVTLDREVRCQAQFHSRLQTRMDNPTLIWGKDIILELKFTNRFPNWFGELVRVFGVRQCGAAKYVDGITAVGVHKLSPNYILQYGNPHEEKGLSLEDFHLKNEKKSL